MTDTERYRSALLGRLAELDSRLHAIECELDTPHTKDWDDAAIEHESDQVLEGLGHRDSDEVARIRAALARIRNGTYGICVSCGEEISPERLDVLPETPLCRSCAASVAAA